MLLKIKFVQLEHTHNIAIILATIIKITALIFILSLFKLQVIKVRGI